MDKALKQRLVGATVLIILAVIVLPMLLSGRSDTLKQESRQIELPPKPEEILNTTNMGAEAATSSVGKIIEIKIPPVGESITEVTIANWTKKAGDLVNAGEMLCEIESDKATFELEAEASGYLEILIEKGTTVSIGTSIARIASVCTSIPRCSLHHSRR